MITGAPPLTVAFTLTEIHGTGPFTYAWDFGDGTGSTSTEQNPTHTYEDAGNYTASVTVTNACGEQVLEEEIEASEGGTCPIGSFICDTFSDGPTTMATHEGEIGATYVLRNGFSHDIPLSAALVDDGVMYTPERGASNSGTFVASGSPDTYLDEEEEVRRVDFYLEADVIVPSGYTGRPQFEFAVERSGEFPISGSPFALAYMQVLPDTSEWYVTAYNSPNASPPTYAGNEQVPFAVDTQYTFRVEYRSDMTDVRVFMDGVLLFQSNTMPTITANEIGIAFYNSYDTDGRTLNVSRFVGVHL